MHSLALVAVDYISVDLECIVRVVINDEVKHLKDAYPEYCTRFTLKNRSLIRTLDIFFSILSKQELTRSVQYSVSSMYRLKKIVCNMISLYVYMHNYFIENETCREGLRSFLSRMDSSVARHMTNLNVLCNKLISSSHLLSDNFMILAICVKGILVCANLISEMFSTNYINKLKRINNPECDLRVTVGIVGTHIMSTNYVGDEIPVDVDFYWPKLGHLCVDALSKFHHFLLFIMNKRYNCSFEKLLFTIASAALINPSVNIFPKKSVFISRGDIRLINSSSKRRVIENDAHSRRTDTSVFSSSCISSEKSLASKSSDEDASHNVDNGVSSCVELEETSSISQEGSLTNCAQENQGLTTHLFQGMVNQDGTNAYCSNFSGTVGTNPEIDKGNSVASYVEGDQVAVSHSMQEMIGQDGMNAYCSNFSGTVGTSPEIDQGNSVASYVEGARGTVSRSMQEMVRPNQMDAYYSNFSGTVRADPEINQENSVTSYIEGTQGTVSHSMQEVVRSNQMDAYYSNFSGTVRASPEINQRNSVYAEGDQGAISHAMQAISTLNELNTGYYDSSVAVGTNPDANIEYNMSKYLEENREDIFSMVEEALFKEASSMNKRHCMNQEEKDLSIVDKIFPEGQLDNCYAEVSSRKNNSNVNMQRYPVADSME